jgi:cytochrome c oxidase cbb3-type subunit 3
MVRYAANYALMKTIIAAFVLMTAFVVNAAAAQNRGGGGGGGGFANAYPQRPAADPAVVARGRGLYDMTCAFCHGEDARGGDGGPNLLRSQIVLDDQKGELIGNLVRSGDGAMPKLEFTDAQLADIATFIHSFRVAGYDASRQRPSTIVIGDDKAGEAYFRSKCGNCHETSGDLKNIAARFPDARAFQQWWLVPGGGGGRGANAQLTPTVTVTPPTGQKMSGRLVRIDDFIVTLADDDEVQHTFRRNGNNPKVEVHDPLQAHKELLRSYTDKDIHDVTAYLESLR